MSDIDNIRYYTNSLDSQLYVPHEQKGLLRKLRGAYDYFSTTSVCEGTGDLVDYAKPKLQAAYDTLTDVVSRFTYRTRNKLKSLTRRNPSLAFAYATDIASSLPEDMQSALADQGYRQLEARYGSNAGEALNKIQKSKKGFTLVELLVAISIITFLFGLTIGVGFNMCRKARRDATNILIMRVEMALEQYQDNFPDGIKSAAELGLLTQEERGQKLAEANKAVAKILYGSGDFSIGVTASRPTEIIKDSDTGGYYLVDVWYHKSDEKHNLNPVGGYSFLNIAKNGRNDPGLDIWSNGPDGQSNRDSTNPNEDGDDVVNWGRR